MNRGCVSPLLVASEPTVDCAVKEGVPRPREGENQAARPWDWLFSLLCVCLWHLLLHKHPHSLWLCLLL